MSRTATSLVGILLAMVAAPAAVAHQTVDVVFAGRLTDSAVEAVIERLEVSSRPRLVVTSAGGEALASARLGEYVYRHNTPVVVKDVCLSACATTLLIAAPSVEFEPGAVVGLHHSATSIVRSYGRMGEAPPPDLVAAAAIEEAIYRARVGSVGLLECAAHKVGQLDHYVERANADGEIRRLFGLRFRWWIPSQTTLQAMGVVVGKGRVNENAGRIAERLNTPTGEIVFGTAGDCL
jgi:hypothetical protein